MNKIFLIFFLLLSSTLFAVSTQYKEQNSYFDFLSGYMDNITLDENGHLSLSPNFKSILDSTENYIWNLVEDSKGEIYCGSGNNGYIYHINGNKSEIFYKSEAQEITGLAIDSKDNVYAGLSPKGLIYKITSKGANSLFATIKSSYIWGMAFDSKKNLYVAAGNPAGIYKISSDGKTVELYFTSSLETHFIALSIDKLDNLYTAGSKEGLVYKISPKKEVSVLFDSEGLEITDILVDKKNNLFVTANYSDFGKPSKTLLSLNPNSDNKTSKHALPKKNRNSCVFKIYPDGHFLKLIDLPKITFLSLSSDQQNNVYVGTGTDGQIYKITDKEIVSLLCSLVDKQILALKSTASGILLAATGNSGNVYKIESNFTSKGTYTSEVFDTFYTSRFGRFTTDASIPSNTSLLISTRSGNSSLPDEFWSDWEEASNTIVSPGRRFFQYKFTFTSSDENKTPVLSSIKFSYKPFNHPPYLDSINMEMPKQSYNNSENTKKFKSFLKQFERKLTWQASDPDKDNLNFTIEFRNQKSRFWKKLTDSLDSDSYTFDSTVLADGYYYFRITVSDLPSNSKTDFLTYSRESHLVLIDNTPPSVQNIKQDYNKGKLYLEAEIEDQFSDIASVSYSFNSKDWVQILPEDGIFDSPKEKIKISLSIPKKTDFLIIKVTDSNNNTHNEAITF